MRLVLMLIIPTFILVGCGGGVDEPPTPVPAENAAVGKTILSDDWEITLLDQPSKDGVIGDEPEANIQTISQYEQAARTADGVWVIVPIKLVNVGNEENMLMQTTIQIEDDQGRQYKIGDRLVHHAQVWLSDVERWGDRSNQLVQNVQDTGVEREGPAIFDVADDATGLRLILKGTDESIDLGFE
ncbi:hypothetical protein KFU94_04240 [Chloroflexi bacterium TSY]|nr:hypothetical protein [Chloroflexi bacterium TSY]